MQRAIAGDLPRKRGWLIRATSQARAGAPTLIELGGAIATSVLLILSFPNFDLPLLAWIAFTPLLIVLARRPSLPSAFVLGWASGTLFFYASCYWLTYSMIHYGGLAPWTAYLLVLLPAIVSGLFPALFAFLTASVVRVWGYKSLLLAPFFWATSEWLRLEVTGQLWNALGYSQAQFLNAALVQSARWGGVYVVGFLIVTVNCSVALVILKRSTQTVLLSCLFVGTAAAVIFAASRSANTSSSSNTPPGLYVVALQPNVPMTIVKTVDETNQLIERHLTMSTTALQSLPNDNVPRLVVWPESPMNFSYASDQNFRELTAKFTQENHVSLLFNSLEPAANNGAYNSALLINEDGRRIAQYDKIRLLPFGEYVPLPQWLGGSLISGLVGDFTPGTNYTLMPVGTYHVGVFICIESAYPSIARTLTHEGADVLINISNDGYLGPTAVMRQHLANAIFRSVENGRPLLRVTNSGLSAALSTTGSIEDITNGFEPAVRTWKVSTTQNDDTFYTKHGDVFIRLCILATLGIFAAAAFRRNRMRRLR